MRRLKQSILTILAVTATATAANAQSADVGAPPMSPADARRAMRASPPMLPPRAEGGPTRGYDGYRQPHYGFVVPSDWRTSSYYIADHSLYGLPRPAAGYGWSRYYDDAVLTDRYGRVYDWRDDVDWSGGYDDDRYRGRRDSGIGGAVAGAVVGGVAGNVIAGRGDRLAGTLIGGGVGALAGAAIDRAEDRGRRSRHDRSYRRDDYGYRGPHWHAGDHAPVATYDHGGCCGSTVTVVTTTHAAAPVTRTITSYENERVAPPVRRKYVQRATKDRRRYD